MDFLADITIESGQIAVEFLIHDLNLRLNDSVDLGAEEGNLRVGIVDGKMSDSIDFALFFVLSHLDDQGVVGLAADVNNLGVSGVEISV